MDKPLSVDADDLLGFFEAIPIQSDADVPWIYNDSAYLATDGRVQISFALVPSCKDVRVLLKTNEALLYELNAIGVEDVKLHNDGGRESLEILVSQRESIWIRTKPAISISQSISEASR